MKKTSVTIRVPGSTSNLGPGFDALGVALGIYNRIRITIRNGEGIEIISAISDKDRAGATAMLSEAASAFGRRTGKAVPGLDVSLTGDVPIARGLGSSVTARLGMVAGLDELAGAGLSRQLILDMVSELEHHPDNAAPAVFGGFAAAGLVEGSVRCVHFKVNSSWRFVTLIPRFEVSTEDARKLVPNSFSKQDAIHNLSRASLITAAFAEGNASALRGLFDDRFHQPYRQKLIPELFRVIAAGERAGAVGGWLSGSGSTIMCLATSDADKIGKAMQRELPNSDVQVLSADNTGYEVEDGGESEK